MKIVNSEQFEAYSEMGIFSSSVTDFNTVKTNHA